MSREGDGHHFLHFTLVLLHVLQFIKHKNYAIEAALMQHQYHYMMSERMQTQFLHLRFVNMLGTKGRKAKTYHVIYK